MTQTKLPTLSAQITELVKNRKGLPGDAIVTEVLNYLDANNLTDIEVEPLLFTICRSFKIPLRDDLGEMLEQLSQQGHDTINTFVIWANIAYTVYKLVAGIFGLPISDKAAEAIEIAYQAMKGGKDAHII